MIIFVFIRIGWIGLQSFYLNSIKFVTTYLVVWRTIRLIIVLVQADVECGSDAECGPDLACLRGVCRDPCDETSCGAGAICSVANTLPFRTLVCQCPKPLTGDASVQCVPSMYKHVYLDNHTRRKYLYYLHIFNKESIPRKYSR